MILRNTDEVVPVIVDDEGEMMVSIDVGIAVVVAAAVVFSRLVSASKARRKRIVVRAC